MQLPVIEQPIYDVKLISQATPIRFRPFTVKEQKIMLMAVEADDLDTTVKAIKQIVNNCLIDKLDVDSLPTVDIELLFLNLRARSMGEILNLYFECKNQVLIPASSGTDKTGTIAWNNPEHYEKCGMIINVDVNVLDVKVENQNLEKKIMLNDEVGVMMKYPSLTDVNNLINKKDEEFAIEIVASCVDYVFDKNGIYKAKEATKEEINSFIDSLSTDKYEKLEKFVESSPKTIYKTEKKCGKCGFEHTFILEGLQDFFR